MTDRSTKREPRRGRQTEITRRPLPLSPLFEIDELDDEEWAEQEDDQQDDDMAAEDAEVELFDDSDDDAEDGIVDGFSTTSLDDDPSTASADEIDADQLPLSCDDLPAITFYCEPDGSAAYVLSEYQTARHWEWIDGLARVLLDRANGSWEGLLKLQATPRKVPQKTLDEYVPTHRRPAKGTLSDMLRTTILSLDGQYFAAIHFFRNNKERTQAGRALARELLESGYERNEVIRQVRSETGAERTTVIGWVKCAENDLKTDVQENTP